MFPAPAGPNPGHLVAVRGWFGPPWRVRGTFAPPLRGNPSGPIRKDSFMATSRASGDVTSTRTPVRTAALAVSVVFLLVGVLGFIPGVTTHYGNMTFAGHQSDAHLLGVFQVSILHNVVHLLFGVVGLLMARTATGAKAFLIGGGAIYLVLWVYGLAVGQDSA